MGMLDWWDAGLESDPEILRSLRVRGGGAPLTSALWPCSVLARSSAIREEFEKVRSLSQLPRSEPVDLDQLVAFLTFMSRLAPQFSKDRRFYFYYMWQKGFLAKWWIGGYDTAKHKPFVVKTLHRRLYVE